MTAMTKKQAMSLITKAAASYAKGREAIQEALTSLMQLAADNGNQHYYLGDAYTELKKLGKYVETGCRDWLVKHCGMQIEGDVVTFGDVDLLRANLELAKQANWWEKDTPVKPSNYTLESEVGKLVKGITAKRKSRQSLLDKAERADNAEEKARLLEAAAAINLELSNGQRAALMAALGVGEAIAEMVEPEAKAA